MSSLTEDVETTKGWDHLSCEGRGVEGNTGLPGRFEEVHVGGQRLLEGLLLGYGLLHPLLGHLLEGLLLSLR